MRNILAEVRYIMTLSNMYVKFCLVLTFHSITGCDTTSYSYGVGKVRLFKKMLKENKAHLLTSLGSNAYSLMDLSEVEMFFKTVLYSVNGEESIVDIRFRMYDKQKNKSSTNLIPDPHSTKEHLK